MVLFLLSDDAHRQLVGPAEKVSGAWDSAKIAGQTDSRKPSGGVADQPQCRALWHSSSPSARSLSRSPSSPPPSFTQSPSPPRLLVRDGQTSPHRPRLVVSRITCPPLSPSPHANIFVLGTAVINTHSLTHASARPTSVSFKLLNNLKKLRKMPLLLQ